MPRSTRNSTLFGLILQAMFMVAASRYQFDLGTFYILLILLLIGQAILFERDNPPERVIETRQYSFVQAPYQAMAAFTITIPIVIPFVLLGRHEIPYAPSDLLNEFITQAIFVSFVETVYMIVTVRTVWYRDQNLGVIAWPLIFGFMHPVVRENWINLRFPIESILGFIYAATFGIYFFILWAGREIFPRRYQRYFGAVTSWISHLTLNMFILVFPLILFSLDLFPLVIP